VPLLLTQKTLVPTAPIWGAVADFTGLKFTHANLADLQVMLLLHPMAGGSSPGSISSTS
jgi:hypothetical protein